MVESALPVVQVGDKTGEVVDIVGNLFRSKRRNVFGGLVTGVLVS